MNKLKERLEKAKVLREKRNKYFKNRALAVIEALTMPDLVMTDKERLDKMYQVAHSALKGICYNSHKDWRKETEEMFNSFTKMGLI